VPGDLVQGDKEWQRTVNAVTRLVFGALPPVEAQHEYAMRQLVEVYTATQNWREKGSLQIYREVMSEMLEAISVARMTGFQGVDRLVAVLGQVNLKALDELTQLDMYNLAFVNLGNAVRSLGTFWSGKFGYAMISAAPLGLIFVYDKSMEALKRFCEHMSMPQGMLELVERGAVEASEALGEVVIGKLRHLIRTKALEFIGGSGSGVLNASGRLARSIGLIDSPSQTRRTRGGRLARHVFSVGVRPGGSDDATGRPPRLYATVLQKAYASRPPLGGRLPYLSGGARQRVEAWATARGISDAKNIPIRYPSRIVWKSQVDLIATKIATQGTYGREWLTRLAAYAVFGAEDLTEVKNIYVMELGRMLAEWGVE
jgi:hypothetical protein